MPSATLNSSRSSKRKPDLPTYGPLAAAWMEANLVHGEGDLFGQPFRCTDDQRQFLDKLLRYDPKTGRLIVRRALLGRAKGWGKTEFIAAVVLFFLAGPLAPTAPNIPIAAASFEQADLLFGTAKVMATEGPLKPFLEAYDTEILIRNAPGRAYRVAAAAGTNDGGRPTVFAADELHEWFGNKARVFLVITNSIAKRRDGLVLMISTAGSQESELLRAQYDYGKSVLSGDVEDPAFLMDWAEADTSLNPHDGPEVRAARARHAHPPGPHHPPAGPVGRAEMARQANPHCEMFGTLEFIERRWHETPEHEWRRYFANQWWTPPLDCWLPPGAWEANEVARCQLDRALPVWVGVDMALKHDSIAVVCAQPQAFGKVRVASKVWIPNGETIDVAAVEAHLRELHRTYDVREVAYDPAYFERSAQALTDDGLPMLEFPQSAQRMVPACQTAYEFICGGRIEHDGNETLASQILAAVPRETDSGWRISKGKSKRKIDAAVALVIAVDRAVARAEPVPEFFFY